MLPFYNVLGLVLKTRSADKRLKDFVNLHNLHRFFSDLWIWRRHREVVAVSLGVSGAKPGMKKCSLGKGTMFVQSFLRSAFNCPGNLRHVVTPDIVRDTRWFRSP